MQSIWNRTPFSKTPMIGRSLGFTSLFAILLLGSVGDALAQNTARTIGETEIITLTIQQTPKLLSTRLTAAVIKAKSRTATLPKNPTLSWNREHFPGDSGESEDSLVVSLPLNLSRATTVQAHLGRSAVARANSNAAVVQSNAVLSSLSELYQLLAIQRQAQIQQRKVSRIATAARIVAVRRESGNVSGYDQARIEIEVELAASSLRQIEAQERNTAHSLARRLGLDPNATTFVGSLEANRGLASVGIAETKSLRLQKEASRHAAKADETAARYWMPTLSISGGLMLGLGDESRYGYIAGITLKLPIHSRTNAIRDTSKATRRLRLARFQEAKWQNSQRKAKAKMALESARTEAKRLTDGTEKYLERIERGAESGYREGQISLIELLDSQRLRGEVETRQLSLALSEKQAELELRASRGEFE